MTEVKVATLNLFNGMGQWELRAPLVVDQLEELRPDVIGFQEVDMALDQAIWIGEQVNNRLPGQPHYRIKDARFQGLATMSRIGFQSHDILDLMTFERIAQRMEFRCDDTPFHLVNTHLHYLPESQQERVDQLKYLLAWLDRDARKLPMVILGDFNAYAVPPEPAVTLMKARYRSAHESVHGREPEKTWMTPVNTCDPSPHGTLDYIFVSEEWRIKEAGLAFDKPALDNANVYPSDHLGLYAVIEL